MLNIGELVTLDLINKACTQDGFQVISSHPAPMMGTLHEYINLQTYPSWNDFLGKPIAVRHGDTVTILAVLGRPFRINPSEEWKIYDVYEVLFGKHICQVFRYNLKELDPLTNV